MKTSASIVLVTSLLTVRIPWEVSTVPASLVMMEMDSLVMTSTSVRNQPWLLFVLIMPSVATFLDTLSANACRDIQEMQPTLAQVRDFIMQHDNWMRSEIKRWAGQWDSWPSELEAIAENRQKRQDKIHLTRESLLTLHVLFQNCYLSSSRLDKNCLVSLFRFLSRVDCVPSCLEGHWIIFSHLKFMHLYFFTVKSSISLSSRDLHSVVVHQTHFSIFFVFRSWLDKSYTRLKNKIYMHCLFWLLKRRGVIYHF